MAHILVIMTPARGTDRLVNEALSAATEGGAGRVTVVYLLDDNRSEHLRDCLASRGFVGVGPASEVSRLANETCALAGAEQLQEVKAWAVERSLECHTEVVRGALGDTVLTLMKTHAPDRVYVATGRVGPLTRLFGERDLRRLRKQLGDTLVSVEAEPAP